VSSTAEAPGSSTVPSRPAREGRLVTWLLGAFLVWIPLQTPVAVVAYQYLHLSVSVGQAILLSKDLWAAGLFAVLLLRHYRQVRFRWFDWFALAYGILVTVYSVVPALLGSHLPALSVVASARELLVPVELYGLGRLAGYAGVSPLSLVRAFLVAATGAAIFSVASWVLLPQDFWMTTYNLLGFIHDVQGITSADSLWAASINGLYGSSGFSLRAVGPFTHPVGAGVYFVVPLILVVCAAWTSDPRRKAALAIFAVGVVLFALAVITPISRGTWMGFVLAAAVGGLVLHKYRLAALTVVAFAAFVFFVPPFSQSIHGALNGTDGSATAHTDAVTHDVEVLIANPAGNGVGQADQAGNVYAAAAGADSAGVGENMYFTTYASVGPLGFLAFVIWMVALLVELMWRLRLSLPLWIPVGVGLGLFAEAAGGFTASTLMRFTTAASIWLLVGLVISVPDSGFRRPNLAAIQRPRTWLRSRGAKPASA
jgi:hypothetical protein